MSFAFKPFLGQEQSQHEAFKGIPVAVCRRSPFLRYKRVQVKFAACITSCAAQGILLHLRTPLVGATFNGPENSGNDEFYLLRPITKETGGLRYLFESRGESSNDEPVPTNKHQPNHHFVKAICTTQQKALGWINSHLKVLFALRPSTVSVQQVVCLRG